jgi:hypothetical protein
MSDIETGGPAFPWCGDLNDCPTINLGMTLRQYAAIKLRVPNSGTDWLDAMILQSLRNEFAGKAMQAYLTQQEVSLAIQKKIIKTSDLCGSSYEWADEMTKAQKPE